MVARVRAGDQAAFEVVYDRYHSSLLSFCRHMLGNPEEAEDALQQVCISAYNSLLADDRPIQLKAWLFAIARNRCLTMLRARREHADVDDVQPAVEGLAAEVQRREDLRELLVDLQKLPDDQRAALVLSELGAHSHEEVAVILDVRKEKVKALVFQAREQLVGSRQAREADCSEIREQLATLRGGALRRTQLRKHLEVCDGCAAFRLEVQRQRAAIAVLLPVVPGTALKGTVLAGVFGGGGGAGAAGLGGGGTAIAGGGAAATGLGVATSGGGGLFAALGAQGVAAKALATIAVAGGAGGTGYVAVNEVRADPEPATVVTAPPPAAAPPVARPVATVVPAATDAAAAARTTETSRDRSGDRVSGGKAGKARKGPKAGRGPSTTPAADGRLPGGSQRPATVGAPAPAASRGNGRRDSNGRPSTTGRPTAKLQRKPASRPRASNGRGTPGRERPAAARLRREKAAKAAPVAPAPAARERPGNGSGSGRSASE